MSRIGLMKAARIKAIHAECRTLGIDADARHDIQRDLTGKASLSDMSLPEVTRVLDAIKNRDTATNEWRFVFRMPLDRRAYGKKIYRLAERVGPLMDPPQKIASKAYIEGITKQMRGTTQPLEFCDGDQLHKVVQALEVFLKRHGG